MDTDLQSGELVAPQSIESERITLGSLLLDPELLLDIEQILKIEDFYMPAHRVIYEAMLALNAQGRPLDLPLVAEEIQRMGKLEDTGGVAYIASLEQYVTISSTAPDHARRVVEKARLRRLIQAAETIIREAGLQRDRDGERLEAPEIIDRAEKAIFQVGQETVSGDFAHVQELALEAMERFEMLAGREGEVSGLRTHFTDLDDMTAGFHPGELIILAARPGIGKTAMALNLALQIAKGGKIHGPRVTQGRPVGFISLEMSREELIQRLLCTIAGVSSRAVRAADISPQSLSKLSEASHQLAQWPIYIDDTAALTPNLLRAKARRLMAREKNLGLLIVDYLQLMRGSESNRAQDNRQQEVSEISRSLKILAKELGIPILALSQLSRNIEQRSSKVKAARPVLSDLRESGSLEQDADVVLFIHRENPRSESRDNKIALPEPYEIIIGKQRNGPVGSVPLLFIPIFTIFYDSMEPREKNPQ